MTQTDINFMTAVELAQRIRSKEISCVEVMQAHLTQIDRVNPKVNAIVTYHPEQALEGAKAADAALQQGDDVGALHGLPVAHKDLVDTAGVRTTYGSPIYADHIPQQDALMVERLKRAGAISVGKTNTPEFGAGSQTFNEVFGATLNPYDLSKTCGGSSGGAAVALACGMTPIADGSDLGGSLRNPSQFLQYRGLSHRGRARSRLALADALVAAVCARSHGAHRAGRRPDVERHRRPRRTLPRRADRRGGDIQPAR